MLIAHCLHWAPAELTRSWLQRIRATGSPTAQQAYGELLALRSVLLKDEVWCREAIQELVLTNADAGPASHELTGLLYGAANLWMDARDRTVLREILCAGMDCSNSGVAAAAMEWFIRVPVLRLDADTRPVLETFASGSSIEATKIEGRVLDRIADLIDDAPTLVYDVASRVLNIVKTEIGNLATASALLSENLLSIALTLQREDEPHRSRGLELFEQLLRYEAYKAQDILFELDRRPGTALSPSDLRPRRRRRAAKRPA
jgi:hypothetical protein